MPPPYLSQQGQGKSVPRDRFERKWQIAWAAAGIAMFGLLFAQQTSAAGVVVCGFADHAVQ